jgi:hypothetical protein
MDANLKELLRQRAKVGDFLSLYFDNGGLSTGRLAEMEEEAGYLIIEQIEAFWKKNSQGDHVPDISINKLIVSIENIHHFSVS